VRADRLLRVFGAVGFLGLSSTGQGSAYRRHAVSAGSLCCSRATVVDRLRLGKTAALTPWHQIHQGVSGPRQMPNTSSCVEAPHLESHFFWHDPWWFAYQVSNAQHTQACLITTMICSAAVCRRATPRRSTFRRTPCRSSGHHKVCKAYSNFMPPPTSRSCPPFRRALLSVQFSLPHANITAIDEAYALCLCHEISTKCRCRRPTESGRIGLKSAG
jgi:hypothetical protein